LLKDPPEDFAFIMISVHQILIEIIKRILKKERPMGACSPSFGFPSGHSAFASSMLTWFLLEHFFLHEKSPFKGWRFYTWTRNAFIVFSPLIPISRYYLNYHTIPQICTGLALGVVISAGMFFFVYKRIVQVEYHIYASSYVVRVWKVLRITDNFSLHEIKERKTSAVIEDIEEGRPVELEMRGVTEETSKRTFKIRRQIFLARLRRIMRRITCRGSEEEIVSQPNEIIASPETVATLKSPSKDAIVTNNSEIVSPPPLEATEKAIEEVVQQEIACEAS